MGLSLWLVSNEAEQKKLIEKQMEILRGAVPSCSARFSPHVTLLPGIEAQDTGDSLEVVWSRTLEAIERWSISAGHPTGRAIECSFSRLTTNGIYFQCILIALHKETSLMSLNMHMREVFSMQDQADYFPHLSLLYSSLTAAEAEEYIDEMRQQGNFHSSSDDKIILCSESNHLSKISLTSIELWNTNGPVEQWKKVKSTML